MASLEKIKLKSGLAYRITYWIKGERHQFYIPPGASYAEAKRKMLEIESSRKPITKQEPLILLELMERYLSARQHEILTERHSFVLASLIGYFGKDFPIAEIDHKKIHEYRDWLLNKRQDRCPGLDFSKEQRLRRGVNKELQNLRTIFKWAYKNDLMRDDIFSKVVFYSTSHPIPSVLTPDQEKAFYHHLPETNIRFAFKILKYTGVRRSELVAIKWKDIDFETGFIHLLKTKNREEEIIPIHENLLRILRYYQERYKPDGDSAVISYHPCAITTMFRRALNAAGLHHIKSPVHVLRHTLGTRIMENDLSDTGERVAQEILRHKTRSMTRHYTKIAKQNLREKFGKMKF